MLLNLGVVMRVQYANEDKALAQTQEYWIPLQEQQGRLYAKSWTPSNKRDETAIVLFHDSLGCVALWRDFPALLAVMTQRTVIAYDRLGFGQSSTYVGEWSMDFIRQEITHYFPLLQHNLALGRFIALGYSVGGTMAACCAALYPTQCQALIMMATPAFVDEGMVHGLTIARELFGQEGQIERLTKYHGDKAAWALSAWLDTWLSEAFATWRIEQVAAQVHCPLLVIHGDCDEYADLSHPQHMMSLSQNDAELVILKDGHHVPHREYPELVLKHIVDFLT